MIQTLDSSKQFKMFGKSIQLRTWCRS